MSNPIFLDVQFVRAQVERLKLEYPEMAEDAELLADSIEGETGLYEVLTRLVRQERDAVAFADAIKSEENRLADRRRRFERRKLITRSLIMSLMDTAEQAKVRLPIATLWITRGRAGCVVTDETLLPDQFVKIERTPREQDITAALIGGQHVPGAELSNPSPHLTVRT